jgi:succinyl-CoA:acetate CoA-transferase
MVPHVDYTEHDIDVVVTEQGVADLRGLSPRERARALIRNCVHPAFRDELEDYFEQACEAGGHVPHDLDQVFSWDAGDLYKLVACGSQTATPSVEVAVPFSKSLYDH